MGLLDGKVAVVTGAGRGIGRAVVEALASEGASVGLAARSADEIEAVANAIRASGGRALAVPTDVSSQPAVDQLFQRVSKEVGEVDILVNNAAILGPTGMLWETGLDAWQEVLEVNFTGVVRCCRAVLPSMISRRCGKIINLGSIAGWDDSWAAGFPEWAAYGCTKAAVMRFSQVLAHQVKQYGVNVNCLGVGAYTPGWYEASVKLARARGTEPPVPPDQMAPNERVLAEENVGAFLFLASALSDHVTGSYFEANALPTRICLWEASTG